ncbi:hypothetical protein HK101_009449 [Irineochytrium annulatum]|nr:hypothetical protein HK101_009449 [Irineochytrium annulatum]
MHFTKVGPFVPNHVRETATRDVESRRRIRERLLHGSAYVETCVGSLAVVEITKGIAELVEEMVRFRPPIAALVLLLTRLDAQARKDRAASEWLVETFSSFLSDVTYIIARHGGDVVHMDGLRALACCSEILTKLDHRKIDLDQFKFVSGDNLHSMSSIDEPDSQLSAGEDMRDPIVRVRLRAMIATGELERVVVGIPNERCEYTIAGGVRKGVRKIMEHTNPGEVGVLESTWVATHLNDPVRSLSNPLRQRHVESCVIYEEDGVDSLHQSALRLLGRLDDGPLVPWRSDIDLPVYGDTIDEESSHYCHLFMNQSLLWRLAKDEEDRETAENRQLKVDNESQTFITICGLPPFYHHNNALLALKTASHLHDHFIRESLIPATISITTGRLHFTKLGSHLRSEMSLLGLAPYVACRLVDMQTRDATVTVICDEETLEGSGGMFKSILYGVRAVKGLARGVTVYHIVFGEGAFPGLEGGTAGRERRMQLKHKAGHHMCLGYEAEKAKLVESVDAWMDSGEEVVSIIEAPSGLGKTTLRNFFLNYLRRKRVKSWLVQASLIK